MEEYCLTYFRVEYQDDFDMKDFCQKLNLDYEYVKNWGGENWLQIGKNENFNFNINVMIRKTIKDLIGKEEVLLQLKNKYKLKYYIERVPLITFEKSDTYQKLSLEDDIIEFMYKSKTSDDLDYHISTNQ